jgi:hypothetical protein
MPCFKGYKKHIPTAAVFAAFASKAGCNGVGISTHPAVGYKGTRKSHRNKTKPTCSWLQQQAAKYNPK